MHTLLISSGLKKSKLNWRPLGRYTLHGVLQERGGYKDGGWHACHWYWDTLTIKMTFQDNGTINGHSTPWWNLQISDGWQTHFCRFLSRNLWSIPSLTKTMHLMRHSGTNVNVITPPCPVHLLLQRRCHFILCQAKFIIWSGGSQCSLGIIWIFSTCMWKWATMSPQKCSSNSKIRQISLCS